MLLCADHGVDPTTASTDHSREYSPLLALGLDAGTLRRRPGGRGRHGLRASHRRDASAARPGDRADAAGRRRAAGAWPSSALTRPSCSARGSPPCRRGLRCGPSSTYEELGWPRTAVPGHGNVLQLVELTAGAARGLRLALACGRPHGYEGWSREELERPVRDLAAAGVSRFVLTNSCGALRPAVTPGEVVACTRRRRSAGSAGGRRAGQPRASAASGGGGGGRRHGAGAGADRRLRRRRRPAVRDAGGGRVAGPPRRRGGHVGGAGGARRARRRRRLLSSGAGGQPGRRGRLARGRARRRRPPCRHAGRRGSAPS